MSTTDIGRLGEKIAARFLKKNGYKILAKNKRQSHNEIDIIAADKELILFVEVKTRSVSSDLYSPYGSPASAVDAKKQARTVQAARSYLMQNPSTSNGLQPRMDVIEVYLDRKTKKVLKVHHIPNAFGVRS